MTFTVEIKINAQQNSQLFHHKFIKISSQCSLFNTFHLTQIFIYFLCNRQQKLHVIYFYPLYCYWSVSKRNVWLTNIHPLAVECVFDLNSLFITVMRKLRFDLFHNKTWFCAFFLHKSYKLVTKLIQWGVSINIQ